MGYDLTVRLFDLCSFLWPSPTIRCAPAPGHAAHDLVALKHITPNLFRLAPVQRKGGIKARRLIAATSGRHCDQRLGLA